MVVGCNEGMFLVTLFLFLVFWWIWCYTLKLSEFAGFGESSRDYFVRIFLNLSVSILLGAMKSLSLVQLRLILLNWPYGMLFSHLLWWSLV